MSTSDTITILLMNATTWYLIAKNQNRIADLMLYIKAGDVDGAAKKMKELRSERLAQAIIWFLILIASIAQIISSAI